MLREQRKLDHIKYALALGDGPAVNGFADVKFLHNCLPELSPTDLDITTALGKIKLSVPFLINAITGGTNSVTEINKNLSQTAVNVGAALAVGSQYGAVKGKSSYRSFEVVREVNPNGIIFANTSALALPAEAQAAVDMIAANALQVHLNPAQELVMAEGDKNFKGILKNILKIREHLSVPIIIKETGSGMASTQMKELINAGFSCLDIGGMGGTNFISIESARINSKANFLDMWGTNTAQSLIETLTVTNNDKSVIATGGIRNGLESAKAFALGANVIGMAGNILRNIIEGGVDEATSAFQNTIEELKMVMLLTGAKNLQELQSTPIYFTNELKDFILCRGYNLTGLSTTRK